MTRRGLLLAAVLLVGAGRPARAQQTAYVPIDRIVGVVGTKPIMMSQIEEQLNERLAELRRQNVPVPSDSAALAAARRQLLDDIVDQELLLQTAQRDTLIKVTDQQVQAAVTQRLRDIRDQFASELEYRSQLRAAGFGTPEEYRRFLGDEARRQLMIGALQSRLRESGELRPMTPTDAELHAAFDKAQGRQQRRPATVTMRQIVIRPQADSAAVAAARQKADSVLGLLRRGADFAGLARRVSDDPSRDQGGELGWFRRSQMVREFEEVAFRLRPGQISDLVRSPFGFHIIQVEKIEPTEIQARHILIAPVISAAAVQRAHDRADSVAAQLRRGAAADSLSRLYHDPAEQAIAENAPRTSLPQAYQDALLNAKPGDIVGPVPVPSGPTGSKFPVLVVLSMRPEGEYTFDEVRDQLRSQVAEEKGVRRYLNSLRQKTYVSIRL
jgi:peptidyl-prolyl cis-trans isomerase SurA